MQHVVKDSGIVQIEWRETDPVGNIVLANGSTIAVSMATMNQVISELTIDVFRIDGVGVDGKRHHVLNKGRIDHIEWLSSDPEGVITLSNGNDIVLGMDQLIQVITVLTETINLNP